MTSTKKAAAVFDPRDGISDEEFLGLVESLRADGATWFTERMLYAQACADDAIPSRTLGLMWLSAGLLSAVGFVTAFVGPFLGAPALAFVGGGAVVMSMVVFTVAWLMPMPVPPESTVRGWVTKWKAAGNSLPNLLEAPALESVPEVEADGALASILIVQHDLWVDLFVRNGLWSRLDAVVVSERGYPRAARNAAISALRERPGLPVLLLHDATEEGLEMYERVQFGSVLPMRERFLRDIGLSPSEVPALPGLEPVSPKARRNRVPLELLPWKTLAEALPQAVRDRCPLSQVVGNR